MPSLAGWDILILFGVITILVFAVIAVGIVLAAGSSRPAAQAPQQNDETPH